MNPEIQTNSVSSIIRLRNLKRRNTAPSGELIHQAVDLKPINTSVVNYRKEVLVKNKRTISLSFSTG